MDAHRAAKASLYFQAGPPGLVSGGGSLLWVEIWSLGGLDLLRHLPQMFDQIGIWGIWGPGELSVTVATVSRKH